MTCKMIYGFNYVEMRTFTDCTMSITKSHFKNEIIYRLSGLIGKSEIHKGDSKSIILGSLDGDVCKSHMKNYSIMCDKLDVIDQTQAL